MDIKRPVTDVSKLAAAFNEEFTSDKPDVKPVTKFSPPTTAPELPSKLKVDSKPEATLELATEEPETPSEMEPMVEPEFDNKPDQTFRGSKN